MFIKIYKTNVKTVVVCYSHRVATDVIFGRLFILDVTLLGYFSELALLYCSC